MFKQQMPMTSTNCIRQYYDFVEIILVGVHTYPLIVLSHTTKILKLGSTMLKPMSSFLVAAMGGMLMCLYVKH
eukprot:384685-Karenia_brevis.AAC.1